MVDARGGTRVGSGHNHEREQDAPMQKAPHGQGQAGQQPSIRSAEQRRDDYDHVNLDMLVGLLSITDSQRATQQNQQDAEAFAAFRTSMGDLEQRARAEEWFLPIQVSARLLQE